MRHRRAGRRRDRADRGSRRRTAPVPATGRGGRRRVSRSPPSACRCGGRRLTGSELAAQLDAWTRAGVMEPSAADHDRRGHGTPGMAAPDRPDRRRARRRRRDGPAAEPAALGRAGGGAGPAACRCVVARHAGGARRAGTLLAPTDAGAAGPGLDLLTGVAAAARWIDRLDGPLVLGNYVYADGVTNLRLAAAVDALTVQLQRTRPETALAFLATPTDVFAVPPEAVEAALEAYERRSRAAKLLGRPLRTPLRWSAAAAALRARRRARDQRLARAAAGSELRVGQAAATLACRGGPRRRRARCR